MEPHLAVVDALALVEHLLRLEHVKVEVLLQLLVGVVDQQLLERVAREDLEAENVQNRDRAAAAVVNARRVECLGRPGGGRGGEGWGKCKRVGGGGRVGEGGCNRV